MTRFRCILIFLYYSPFPFKKSVLCVYGVFVYVHVHATAYVGCIWRVCTHARHSIWKTEDDLVEPVLSSALT